MQADFSAAPTMGFVGEILGAVTTLFGESAAEAAERQTREQERIYDAQVKLARVQGQVTQQVQSQQAQVAAQQARAQRNILLIAGGIGLTGLGMALYFRKKRR